MTLVNLFAAGESFNDFSSILKDLIKQMWAPCIGIASALTLLWGLYIGWKFWSAGGDEQKKKSAKGALVSFGVGLVVIFVIAAGAPIFIAALSNWLSDSQAAISYLSMFLYR